MIVVCIIGILSAIAAPRFANMRRKSMEATTLGNLAALRGAAAMHHSNFEGADLTDLQDLVPVYINRIPAAMTWHHPSWNSTGAGTFAQSNVAPGSSKNWWLVVGDGESMRGRIFVNCDHRDLKGRRWYDEH
jgi:type II secretory pathway pseudopilin PulG